MNTQSEKVINEIKHRISVIKSDPVLFKRCTDEKFDIIQLNSVFTEALPKLETTSDELDEMSMCAMSSILVRLKSIMGDWYTCIEDVPEEDVMKLQELYKDYVPSVKKVVATFEETLAPLSKSSIDAQKITEAVEELRNSLELCNTFEGFAKLYIYDVNTAVMAISTFEHFITGIGGVQ